MLGLSDITWDGIREGILYHTSCLVVDRIRYVILLFILFYVQQNIRWEKWWDILFTFFFFIHFT